MAEAVEGHGTRRAGVLDVGPVGPNKRLQVLDRRMSFHVIRHKELMAAGRGLQMQLQAAHQQGMQRDRPDEAAFALDGDGPLPDRPGRDGRVDPEALMDAQARIPGQIEDRHIVLPAQAQRLRQHPGELLPAPGAVDAAEGAPLQRDLQLLIVGQLVFGVHQVMKKTDGGQVCFDGAGSLPIVLQLQDIGGQMLPADVGQLLQAEGISQEGAEPLHGLVIPLLGAEAPLAVMTGQLVQLGEQAEVNTDIQNLVCHICTSPYSVK